MACKGSTICGVSKLIKTNSFGNLAEALEFRRKFNDLECKHRQLSKGNYLCLPLPDVGEIRCPLGLRNLLLPHMSIEQRYASL